MNATPYDFRKPSRLATELQEQLVAWLSQACALVPEKWAKELALPIEHSVLAVETARPTDALASLDDAVAAYRVTLGASALATLMVLKRPHALALVAGMMGDACQKFPADRALTPVEASLVEYLLQQLLRAIQEAWPADEQPAVTLGQAEPAPKRARLFAPDDNIVCCFFSMRGPFGEETWQWWIPQTGLTNLLGQTTAGPVAGPNQNVRSRLESLIGELPLQVSVQLGSASLHLAQLVGMRAGDVVILDQPVSQPLAASVAGKTRFHVWPGRVGDKQSFQIESMVEC